MAEQVNTIIAAKVQLDTSQASANAKNLNKDLGSVKSELKDTSATAATAGKNLSSASGSFKNIKDQITGLPGPLNQAEKGVGGLNAAFNILKANPIIGVIALIAGLVVALFSKFQKMEAVSDSLGKAFGQLSTIFNWFINKILTPLIDGFTWLVDLITKSATFIADIFSPGIAEAAERAGELADALDDLNDAEAESALRRAESNRKLQEARDLSEDANVPIKERIVALKEAGRIESEEHDKSIAIAKQRARIMLEQIGLELDVRKDLLQAIRNGTDAQLKAARDEIYAMKNVDKEKLKAIDELIIQADNEGAERARITKRTATQITSLENEERAKQKEAADKAREAQKAAEQKLFEFRSKLRQLQQDNELSQIKDGYQKELLALQQKLQNEKLANEQAIKDKKLTRAQADQLNAELDKQAALKKAEFDDKHNKEVADKEVAFQTALAKLKQDIALGGIVDQRTLEREQLRVSHEQQLAEAEKAYKDDAEKLAQVKLLIDEKYRQDQAKQEKKYRDEDDKAALDLELKRQEGIVNEHNFDFEAKRAALDAEQLLIQDAFDKKLIVESDYNAKVQDLANKRMQIAEMETQHKKQQTQEIADALGVLGEVVGKQTVAGKALGIATALINTWQGASEALKQKSTLPSPFDVVAKIANVAAVVAAGLKTVREITKVQVPGGGGSSQGTGSAPTIAAPAPIAPTQASTAIDQNSINGIGDATKGRNYVLDADVRNAADRDARLSRAARLGG